jgi:HK97 family phage prohead protease
VYEILEPGCISNELLQRSDVILNINHSNKVTDVLGRCNNGKGTLDLALRENFIEAECDLPKTNAANDTLELIKRGDISGMSFAFEDDWEDTENGVSYERTDEVEDGKEVWLRHVKRITGLYDVSIVTHPAYEQTSVGTREAGNEIDKAIDRQVEKQNEQQRKAAEESTTDEEFEKMQQQQLEKMEQQLRDIRRNIAEIELDNDIY